MLTTVLVVNSTLDLKITPVLNVLMALTLMVLIPAKTVQQLTAHHAITIPVLNVSLTLSLLTLNVDIPAMPS